MLWGRSIRLVLFIYTGAITFFVSELVCSVMGNRAIFYDQPNYEGNSMTLSISGGCYRFKKKWSARIVSIDVHPQTSCLMAWRDADCGGKSLQLTPTSEYNWDLRQIGFDKQIKSISLCYEISYRLISAEDRMLNPSANDDSIVNGHHLLDPTKHKVDLNFYDKPKYDGSILTVTYYGGCYTFKPKWMNRISSLELMGRCIAVWDREECEGSSVNLDSSTLQQSQDLALVNFDKRAKSISLCSSSISSSFSGEEDDAPMAPDSGSFEESQRQNDDMGSNERNAPPSQNSQIDDAGISDEMIKVALSEHNKFRRIHGVSDLQWDSKLHKTAQSFANYLAQNNKFHHSTDNDFGENLGGVSTQDKISALKQVIRLWYNEIANYDFKNPGHSVMGLRAGHFTQLVWKETSNMGLGMAWNPRRNWWVIVANYDPPGNFKGDYQSNVFPPNR